ncbi:MAG TPA: ATP-binding cassette domain-containing protein, partial [Spirochaetia bacterium]|nr:ATP-binding cassette domain-containing protein [Spirochaetia bacterium]
HFLDALSGIATLKAFGAARREAGVIARISDEHRLATLGVVKIAFVSSLMLELITTVSIALVAVTAGFRLLAGQLDFHRAYFILLIAPEFYQPLRTMGLHYHARMTAAAAAERIVEVLEEDQEAHNRHAVSTSGYVPCAGGIELSDVTFAYTDAADGRRPVFSDLSFTVSEGERLAIFGQSGVGKSTLFALLLRFVDPDSGSIRVGGREIAAWDTRQWLASISWMPQRPTLFAGTVADNIRLGRRDAGDREVHAAARRAFADEFIDRLPQKFETRVGDGGRGLSGGQIQRLALARLFLRDSPLLLLDEPAAHLDLESEELVYRGIAELASGRTLIVVTHRPGTTGLVDRIIVLDEGRNAESGSPEALLASGGIYSRMVESFKAVL